MAAAADVTAGPRPIADVLDLDAEVIELAPLLDAVRDGDVLLGVFTDEELAWSRPDPQTPADPLDEPRLARLDDGQREVALNTTLWILLARGDARRDGDRIVLQGILAALGDLRHATEAAASVETHLRRGGPAASRRLLVHRTRPDLYVTEEVDDDGMHRLLAVSPARVTQMVAAALDPLERAGPSEPPIITRWLADLRPHPDQLAGTADSAAAAIVVEADDTRRVVTAYGDGDGLALLHGVDGEQVVLQRLAPVDVLTYVRAWLTGAADGEVA